MKETFGGTLKKSMKFYRKRRKLKKFWRKRKAGNCGEG